MSDIFTRAATVEPSSYNAERGTVEVVFSTGADVARRDLGGAYVERLRIDQGAWNLSQLLGGPVLDSHRRDRVRDVIGTVEMATVENNRAIATIRFSDRDDVAGIRRDIQTGILKSVSVGYQANYREFIGKREQGARGDQHRPARDQCDSAGRGPAGASQKRGGYDRRHAEPDPRDCGCGAGARRIRGQPDRD